MEPHPNDYSPEKFRTIHWRLNSTKPIQVVLGIQSLYNMIFFLSSLQEPVFLEVAPELAPLLYPHIDNVLVGEKCRQVIEKVKVLLGPMAQGFVRLAFREQATFLRQQAAINGVVANTDESPQDGEHVINDYPELDAPTINCTTTSEEDLAIFEEFFIPSKKMRLEDVVIENDFFNTHNDELPSPTGTLLDLDDEAPKSPEELIEESDEEDISMLTTNWRDKYFDEQYKEMCGSVQNF